MTAPSPAVIQALATCRDPGACLALVLETEGSTYVRAGAMALFGDACGQVGWLSGGCLEPEIESRARRAAAQQHIAWLQIDTREDEDLFSGSALGCRGRLHLVLLPLQALPTWPARFAAWWRGRETLSLSLERSGCITLALGAEQDVATLATETPPEVIRSDAAPWRLAFTPPPRVAVFGAGPESTVLLPLLRRLGWFVVLIETRARWQEPARLADAQLALSPTEAVRDPAVCDADAALVMHHHFERDREALEALASMPIRFVGLLGPTRRREDLFRVLPAELGMTLRPRLHSPVGLKLGGEGADAIALSIAAELQAWRHGE
jgi:xanthine dehydrogenase accessory factor